ncbi:hypothetical protein DPQ25_00620 [Hydrogeniiclostridium mannosilyticum]|uniref:Uncharacterized protein n=1 Tax=Hydrogeniiclostridium mannosilyticum TaxID=2764322 RepID=A0A328UEJ4_9FIRM|nr:hypothetical protein [Hydrogeniiclostridium mannosilyticum]RAQ30046.1 hypothetical protein DPQ25_00620 [Hydrogeniiclostridium mannosilyticum]
MKSEFIIEMVNGILNGVYSVRPISCDVRVYDREDLYDEERTEEYWRNCVLIESGCVNDINGETVSEAPQPLYKNKQIEDFQRLFADNPTGERKLAFLEGFLYAWALVNRNIRDMWRSEDEREREQGREGFELFKPMLYDWLNIYDQLFKDLWKYAEERKGC